VASRLGRWPEVRVLPVNRTAAPLRSYPDLHDHLAALECAGLLHRVTVPINKDTEMHPLVRWQFRGGIPEKCRKAFLFTHVTDSRGRRYDMPVLIGAIAGSPEIYRIGMQVSRLADIGPAWSRAIAQPIPPTLVEEAPCQELVFRGTELEGDGNELCAEVGDGVKG
jgi:3-polyprenyl-4-hydroxybenzoate decarboxylase